MLSEHIIMPMPNEGIDVEEHEDHEIVLGSEGEVRSILDELETDLKSKNKENVFVSFMEVIQTIPADILDDAEVYLPLLRQLNGTVRSYVLDENPHDMDELAKIPKRAIFSGWKQQPDFNQRTVVGPAMMITDDLPTEILKGENMTGKRNWNTPLLMEHLRSIIEGYCRRLH